MYKQTNGFIVCNSLDVKLIGGKKCGRCSFFDYITIDQIGVIEDHLIICNYHQNSKNYEKVFMWQQLLGMNVKIIKGDQRGSTGVITNIMNDTLQILLDYTSMLFCTTKENVKFIRRNKIVHRSYFGNPRRNSVFIVFRRVPFLDHFTKAIFFSNQKFYCMQSLNHLS
ncbi:hypothetical protein C0J52_24852 [Blattella germanica]|nr:hypothetical protein C0J52_24852 [Blattella germanica]